MSNKIVTGVWFVFFGVIVLLSNLDWIDFNFRALWQYWPLIIVSVGISLLTKGRKYDLVINLLVNLMMCLFLLVLGLTFTEDSNTVDVSDRIERVSASNTPEIKTAEIQFNGAGLTIANDEISDHKNIFEAQSPNSAANLILKESGSENKKFSLTSEAEEMKSGSDAIHLAFANSVTWDISCDVDAVSAKLDFSDLDVKAFNINSSSSSFKVKYGMAKNGTSVIRINTDASSIKLTLPKAAEYAIKSTSTMSSFKYAGARKTGKETWQTDGYATATDKYLIETDGVANSFAIDQY